MKEHTPLRLRLRIIARTRELTTSLFAELQPRRAGNVSSDGIDELGDDTRDSSSKTALERIGNDSQRCRRQEALEVVAREEVVGIVEDATGQVAEVEPDVGVGRAGVTAEAEAVGVGQELRNQVGEDVDGVVLVCYGALVPVVWDGLVA